MGPTMPQHPGRPIRDNRPDQDMADWWWHKQVLHGMVRELIVNGWSKSDVSRSLFRAVASTKTRCLTTAIARRSAFLQWTMHVVSTDWLELVQWVDARSIQPDSRPLSHC